ncbi:SDR family NAD(P)-dependent oxidoreductase [Flammeovirga aprica]|uniref:SDR family oxidoreductase n=1 Tax=Flammeovirga aprica JL-4 TaxID=694437 RepID=A0A7X9RWB4_9BACT|nr:SDR family oxidoreductase [Flammeovirga aprica]NME69931.1 SDR family oxidoreductase [Flammeovirga aprica JL-4]
MKNVALITGASSGIGKEFAKIHAQKGGDLVIIARSLDKLKELKTELEGSYGISVEVIAKDLTKIETAQEIYDEVKSKNIPVEYLINNAGFGGVGKFHEREWEKDLAMINLNITALTALTRFFLPDMVKRNSGRVLNVSSTASLIPGPLQAVYYATKAYVTFFSNAIAEELHDTNVTVTALLPGATATEFGRVSGMDKTSLFDKTASAYKVALDGYNGMMKGKLDVISGLTTSQKIMTAFAPLTPKKIILKQVRQMQETN